MTTDHTPHAEQTALCDRIAEAIWARYPDAEPSRTGLVLANPHAVADAVLAVLPPPVSRADAYREAADRLAELRAAEREWLPATGLHKGEQELRRMADEAQPGTKAQQQPKPKPIVGYSGKGRVWCLTCPPPDGEDVPITVDDLTPYEECAGCRREVVEVAAAQQDGSRS